MHLEALKDNPEPGLQLIEPLRADPSRYVQNSVANRLNDAARSQPDWVRWLAASDGKATVHICKPGQRALEQGGGNEPGRALRRRHEILRCQTALQSTQESRTDARRWPH